VAFGITGDLARNMTFRSLYRLERRGLLGCPIIGVGLEDWSVERLRGHARRAIQASSGAPGASGSPNAWPRRAGTVLQRPRQRGELDALACARTARFA
jgi:glucose-6-phosphate 1-dehydrogenase